MRATLIALALTACAEVADPRAPHLAAAEAAMRAQDFARARVALDAAFVVQPGAVVQDARERLLVVEVAATGAVKDEAALRYALERVTLRGELVDERARIEGRHALTRTADAALKVGDVQGARAALTALVTLAPADAAPKRQLAALLRAVDREACERLLTDAVALAPDAWSTFTLGVLQQEDGHHAAAVASLEQATALDPTAYAPSYHLALSLAQLGDQQAWRVALWRYLDTSRGVASEAERRASVESALGVTPPNGPAPVAASPLTPATDKP